MRIQGFCLGCKKIKTIRFKGYPLRGVPHGRCDSCDRRPAPTK